MLIKYVGHSCFKIRDNETGYSIVLDPFKHGSVEGYGKIVGLFFLNKAQQDIQKSVNRAYGRSFR